MAEKEQKLVAFGTGVAVAAGLAFLTGGKSSGSFPAEAMQLLIAMAQSLEDQNAKLDELVSAVKGLVLAGSGLVPNADSFIAFRVQCAIAGQGYQLPDFPVPDGFQVALKGWPANANLIWIGRTAAESINTNQIFPLLPNEALNLQVKNTSSIYVSAVVAGDWVVCVVEQKKG